MILPICNLRWQPKATRDNAGKRAFTLSEPCPVPLTCPLTSEQIRAVIAWMRVDQSARYIARAGQTHCNIYAHDLCWILGAYLPRVWWKDPARVTRDTEAVYGKNCRELDANALVGWMREYGAAFGWEVHDTPPVLAGGDVGVVIGRKARGHGHVQVLFLDRASQAGTKNFQVGAPYSADFWSGYADAVWAVQRAGALGGVNVG